jgi:hypothetical protein
MKKALIPAIAVIIAVFLCLYALPAIQKTLAFSRGKEIKAVIVYNPEYLQKTPYILDAYKSVLQEEGVPFEGFNVFQLATIGVDDFVKKAPVMILPDGILQNAPAQFGEWIKEYLTKGGNVAVIYDAGIRRPNGYFLDRSVFADIVGLNYITVSTAGTQAFDSGHIKFSSEASRDFFQIPLGKTTDGLTLSGYKYGPLQYPLARNKSIRELPEKNIYANGITANNVQFPAIVLTEYGAGKVLYVNLPLGYLKANADDLPLRSVLRTFLFNVVGFPHVMNTEAGRGAIVIDWHVDSAIEHRTLPLMEKMGLLRKNISVSFDITAGDFLDRVGDGQGFDACGKGKRLTETLKEYGTIGSHGGWAHNWFAKNIEDGVFKEKEIRENIEKNNKCLETVTGYKITEYAAPVGVHRQPETTRILEDLGMIAYYYTGDTGSGPNRTFHQGKMVSEKVIAFPIMPFGRTASLYEMAELDKRSDSEVKEWLLNLLSYVARNRTTRLFYSHPYNIELYPTAVKAFIDQAETMQQNREISVRSMSDSARFFLRFLKTQYSFQAEGVSLNVSLANPEGLAGITVALPKAQYSRPSEGDYVISEDGENIYVTITSNETKRSFLCNHR